MTALLPLEGYSTHDTQSLRLILLLRGARAELAEQALFVSLETEGARGGRAAAVAYEALWRLLLQVLTRLPGADRSDSTLRAWLEDELDGSVELGAELMAALPARLGEPGPLSGLDVVLNRARYRELRHGEHTADSTRLADGVALLGLPALAAYVRVPGHLERLAAWYIVLLQDLWQRLAIPTQLTEREQQDPAASDYVPASQQLWAIALDGHMSYRELLDLLVVSSGPAPAMARSPQFSVAAGTRESVPAAWAAPSDQPADDVCFTVYRPRHVRPARWETLLAFAHRAERATDAPADEPDPWQIVEQQAGAILGSELNRFEQRKEDAIMAVPFEARLDFIPSVPGVEFDPPRASFRWTGAVQRAEFRLRAPASLAGQMVRGQLRVMFGSILLSELTLILKVSTTDAVSSTTFERATASKYRKIFASYSHKDSVIVNQFREYVKAFGDRYLVDVESLRAGEDWSEALRDLITQADVFQLFWSWNALRSEFVRHEWEYALSLAKPDFIRPTYWEDPLPEADGLPPHALRQLHFHPMHLLSSPPPSAAVAPAGMIAPVDTPVAVASARKRRLPLLVIGSTVASAMLALLLVFSPKPQDVEPNAPVGAAPSEPQTQSPAIAPPEPQPAASSHPEASRPDPAKPPRKGSHYHRWELADPDPVPSEEIQPIPPLHSGSERSEAAALSYVLEVITVPAHARVSVDQRTITSPGRLRFEELGPTTHVRVSKPGFKSAIAKVQRSRFEPEGGSLRYTLEVTLVPN